MALRRSGKKQKNRTIKMKSSVSLARNVIHGCSRTLSSFRYVPETIPKTDYYSSGSPMQSPEGSYIFSSDEVKIMREAATIAREVLDYACSVAEAGMTTDNVDKYAHEEMIRRGVFPSPLNYHGFPKSICTSVNEVACHGIPSPNVKLKNGDMLSIDVSLFHRGFHGDNCATVIVGESALPDSRELTAHRALIASNVRALNAAIAACGPGRCITEIGAAIQRVADADGFSVIEEFCGHGLGKILHMSPLILHYRNDHKEIMRPNMVFTIEPIFAIGNGDVAIAQEDGWSVFTRDGNMTSQFEHEVLITEHGAEILTLPSR